MVPATKSGQDASFSIFGGWHLFPESVVLDYDADGRLVGIDVDNAGNKIELQKVLLSKLPGKVETEAA